MQKNHPSPGSHTRPNHNPPFSPVFGLILGILTASTSSILIRLAQEDAPSLVIAAYRLGLATIALVPLLLTRHRKALQAMSRREIYLTLLAGIFLAFHFATWITSLEFTSVASSVVLVQTSPLFVTILSPLLLRESLSRPLVIGLTLSLVGGVVVGLSDACAWTKGLQCPSLEIFIQGNAIKGDLLALIGALTGAGYLLMGRLLRGSVSLVPYITLTYGSASLILTTMTFFAGYPLFEYQPVTYAWFVLLAMLPQLIAHSTYNWALRYVSATLVSIALLGEPVASTVLAYIFLGETPPALRITGAALILAGITVASLGQNVSLVRA